MFKKFLTIVGTYSFCVFIYKLSNATTKAAGPILDRVLDDIDPSK